ncbi:hypothetical protein [Xanthomonas albilineans]|uniref:hypothetical protein n=1 Tax=Xanthomonas albilineans TaxID=29447 RepID=UPI0005F32553|nr:hypothetical protein [Xanthomonas albilineans]
MNAVIHLSAYVPRLDNAHAAFAAVHAAAIRMGYAPHLAIIAGRKAKQDVLSGRGSTASVVADIKRDLLLGSHSNGDK